MNPTNKIQLKKITKSLGDMTYLIIENHNRANKCIEKNDKKLAIEVFDRDKQIDREFFSIQSELEFMVTKTPVTKNLRRTIASLHMVSHLERIGDYAKKIAKFVIKSDSISASSVRRITKVQNKFRDMIEQVPKIIVEENIDLAKKLWKEDDEVDNIVEEIRKEVITSVAVKSNKMAISERLFVLNIANSFERAADHITKICELIHYIKTSQHLNLK